jgi:branched-chain amino acid transport system ATP-binding protein
MPNLLRVEKLSAFYGPVQILHDIDLSVETGQIVGLVGANAAGKSTLLFSLAGLRTRSTGRLILEGERIDALPPYERVGRGLVLVPERRRLFPFMSVLENLEIGAYSGIARPVRNETMEQVYALLPVLAERRGQLAGSLSGGEQQMLAIGRALMAKPRVLLLDEPTEGLAPRYVGLLYRVVQDLRQQKHTILIVEQSVQHVLRIADRAYLLEHGHIVMEGSGAELLKDERLKVAYLGL